MNSWEIQLLSSIISIYFLLRHVHNPLPASLVTLQFELKIKKFPLACVQNFLEINIISSQ